MTRDLGFSLSWLTLIRLPFLTNQLHWGPYLNRTLCTVLNKVIIWDDVCISAKCSRKERNNTDKKLNIYNQYIMYSTKEFLIREVLSFSARSIDNILPIFCHFFICLESVCRSGWVNHKDKCYMFSRMAETWGVATVSRISKPFPSLIVCCSNIFRI